MKTVFGYLLRLLGIIFSLSFIGNILNLIKGNFPESTIGKVETFTALILAVILAYLCFKYGNKKLDEVKRAKEIDGE